MDLASGTNKTDVIRWRYIAGVRPLGYIDATRGIAILMVILVHHSQEAAKIVAVPWQLAYGQLGVQLFFVASAVTLCLSMNRKPDVGAFYVRRFFRIAPLYWLAIAVYGLLDYGQHTPGNVLANATFFHGFVKDAQNGVVPGGWSIGAEMAFYAWFPLAFFAAKWSVDRYGRKSVALIAVAAFLAHAAFWLWLAPLPLLRNNVFYYWPPSHVPVFLIGMAAYFWIRGEFRTEARLQCLSAFALLTALNLALWKMFPDWAFIVIPSIAAVSFVALMRVLASLPGSRIVEAIGRPSYSIYVFHFMVLWFTDEYLLRAFLSAGPVASYCAAFIVVTAISFAVAMASKAIIEDPGIRLGRALVGRRPVPEVASGL